MDVASDSDSTDDSVVLATNKKKSKNSTALFPKLRWTQCVRITMQKKNNNKTN